MRSQEQSSYHFSCKSHPRPQTFDYAVFVDCDTLIMDGLGQVSRERKL
jgi:hypothetical protein